MAYMRIKIMRTILKLLSPQFIHSPFLHAHYLAIGFSFLLQFVNVVSIIRTVLGLKQRNNNNNMTRLVVHVFRFLLNLLTSSSTQTRKAVKVLVFFLRQIEFTYILSLISRCFNKDEFLHCFSQLPFEDVLWKVHECLHTHGYYM